MPNKTIQLVFFAVFTIGLSVLLFFVLKPYIGVIFVAGVLMIVFRPLYKKLVEKFDGRKNLASAATTLLILIFIVVPIIIMSALLLKEAINLYNAIAFGNASQNFISQVNALIGNFNTQVNLELYARNILNWIIGNFDSVFSAVFSSVLNFILMLVSLYYLFIFGDKIKKNLIVWSPLPDEFDEEFIQTMKSSVEAVLRGRLLVSLVQGVFIGIGFAIFGIGSPVLWGFIGAVASLVPILGTSIITIPAVAYLFLSHNFGAGLGLLIWGALAVGLIDNVISVIFLKGKIKAHPLIILFSILGGVEVFGAVGLLAGPVIVSAFLALMQIYPFIMFYKKQQT